ncbi:transposase [Candidatus Parcubacteria bacterium]|nr:MAG: transposase [Candidatus Parcubacteria bacterium]
MLRCFRYKLRPTKAQKKLLQKHLSDLCWLYNKCIETIKVAYEAQQPYPSRNGLNKLIKLWMVEKPELRNIHSQVLQNVCDRVDKAFKAFFRRVKAGETPGYPRFKSWQSYKSFTYPQSGFSLKDGILKLSKLGKLRVNYHRELRGIIKTCTLKRDAVGDYWVTFATEVDKEPLMPSTAVVGIDFGLKDLVTLDDGTKFPAPKYYRMLEKSLAKAQRKLSKLDKKSKAYIKQQIIVAKIHRKITNQRHNYTHQLSSYLVKNYGTIIHEDLDLRQLIAKNYAKSWHDAAVGLLTSQITYKAESAGRNCIGVNPAYTSQKCSSCGQLVPKDLSVRTHQCSCGYIADRDVNAAKNIKRLGLQSLKELGSTSLLLFRSPHLQVGV